MRKHPSPYDDSLRLTGSHMTPDDQMLHGLLYLDDYEREPDERYLAIGLRHCLIALWRQNT